MRLHLVDATYELFRAHYAPRPPTLGVDGMNLSGVAGVVDQMLFLLREEGATHVGCATDHVIESFRNDMFPGYKSSFGMPPDLLDQFPIAELHAAGCEFSISAVGRGLASGSAAAAGAGASAAKRRDPARAGRG